jgi:hypothetical protein
MYCDDVEGWFTYDDYLAYTDIVSNFTNGNFAEIGCWKGRSLCSIMPMLLHYDYKNIYAIDHWMGSIYERDTTHKEAVTNDIHVQFVKNLETHGYGDKYKVLKMDSVEAASHFEDGFFDVVFIDGDHVYTGISRDLDAWTSKVKAGGILCGHDAGYQPIDTALTERFGNRWNRIGGSVWAVNL